MNKGFPALVVLLSTKITNSVHDYLADTNEEATEMYERLVRQLAETENITEQFKAENQLLWVQRMNNIRNRATEIVNKELIYV